jgi:predicted  nucleic acid-binding Zn ribbon protein
MQEFKKWLLRRLPGSRVYSRAQPHDPPDFWLWHNGEKYAAEVTCIVHENDRTITESQWNVVDRAEKSARRAGVLSGTYLVGFRSPLAKGQQRGKLHDLIIDYVRRTASVPTADQDYIRIGNQVICDIQKLNGRGAQICQIDGGLDIGGFESDIRRELAELLGRSLTAKAKILPKVNCKTILVLYDLYRFASKAMFSECVRACPEQGEFHTIYVVQDKDAGYVIRTRFPSPA